MRTVLLLLVLSACEQLPSPGELSPFRAQAMQPVDDPATVIAGLPPGTCLPAGDFAVVTPPPPRHDWVLHGSLCGAGAGQTRVHFTGDGGGKFWVGLMLDSGSVVRDVSLDTVGFTNYCAGGKNGWCEQTHLLKEYQGINNVIVADVEMNHPIGGDCINVVGPAAVINGVIVDPYVPNSGLTIDHVTFARCQRGGVQVSRGLTGLIVSDSTFLDTGFDIGSEGAGGYVSGVVVQTVTGVRLTHNTHTSPRAAGYALQAEWWSGAVIDHNTSSVRPWELYGSDSIATSYNAISTGFTNAAALVIGDRGWHITSTYDSFTGAVGSVSAGQLGRGRPSDVGDLSFTSTILGGDMTLRGVTGAALTGDLLSGALMTPPGLAANGQPVQQTTGVVVTP